MAAMEGIMNFMELTEASRFYSIDVHEMKKVAMYFLGDDLASSYDKAMASFSERLIKEERGSESELECIALMKRANQIFRGGK